MRLARFCNLGWKSLLMLSAVAALLAGWGAWMVLPLVPRVVMPSVGRAAFSRDCRLVACWHGMDEEPRHWKGELHVWDTRERRLLCAIPHAEVYPPATDAGHTVAFTPEGDKLVVFAWGEAKFFKLLSGEAWQPPIVQQFPRDGKEPTPSWLITDPDGNLFVLTRHQQKKTASIRDLWTGAETAAFEQCEYITSHDGGVIIEGDAGEQRVRVVPTGEVRLRFRNRRLAGSLLMEEYAAAPDGRTLVRVDGMVRRVTAAGEEELDLRGWRAPALSPDGRMLAVQCMRQKVRPAWYARVLDAFGIHRDSPLVIYDLTTRRELGGTPGAGWPQFSADGSTLAVRRDDAVELYDLPLTRPWLRIIVVSIVAASVTFAAGTALSWYSRRPTPNANRPA